MEISNICGYVSLEFRNGGTNYINVAVVGC